MTKSAVRYLVLPLLAVLACNPAQARFAGSQDGPPPAAADSGEDRGVTPITATGAGQRAKIARLRAMAGGAQYRPSVKCESDITNNAEWSGNTTILVTGSCPAYMRNRQ
jgi:hypothetical protein